MKKLPRYALVLALVLVGSRGLASAEPSFDTGSVRGRYSGHLVVGATLTDGTTSARLEAQLLAALTFDGKSAVEGITSITVTAPFQAPYSCPFAATGTYQVGEYGLGTAVVTLVPTDATCGDGGDGGVTLQLALVVGGYNRRRLDVSVSGATGLPNGEPLPWVGTGTLEK